MGVADSSAVRARKIDANCIPDCLFFRDVSVLLRLVLELLLFETKPLDLHLLNDLSAMSYIAPGTAFTTKDASLT